MAKALADRLAEAAAEWLHREVRMTYWGYAKGESAGQCGPHRRKIPRHPPGTWLPRLPRPPRKKTLWQLLDVEKHIGVSLTESLAMWPASSVSGYYFAHPDARISALGKILPDQLEDYAQRVTNPG